MQDKATARRIMLLQGMPLFAGLPEKDLETIVLDLRLKEYGRDEGDLSPGRRKPRSLFRSEGQGADLYDQPSGNETSIAIFSTNDAIGELAAVDRAAFGHGYQRRLAAEHVARALCLPSGDAAALCHGLHSPAVG